MTDDTRTALALHYSVVLLLSLCSTGLTTLCYECHTKLDCRTGRCRGHLCVKSFVVNYVSKGCHNRTAQMNVSMSCQKMDNFLGFPTTVCYCDKDFCNRSPRPSGKIPSLVCLALLIVWGLR